MFENVDKTVDNNGYINTNTLHLKVVVVIIIIVFIFVVFIIQNNYYYLVTNYYLDDLK